MSDDTSKMNLYAAFQFPAYLIIVLWTVHILKVAEVFRFGRFGLLPRDLDGMLGILTAPFIHGNFQHLMSNSVPLFVLSFLIVLFYRKVAYQSMLLIYLLTGLTVWGFARGNVMHIGASGVVYGLVSFVFWTGLFRRNIKSIILALIVTFLYSGYFLGVLPNQRGISWESHLFGGLVGILVAYWMKDFIDREKIHEPVEMETESYVLPRNVFDQTKKERLRQQGSGVWDSDHT